MAAQPTFETDRLRLQPRRRRDLDACYAMNMEPGTVDQIDFPRAGNWSDETAHRAFLEETFAHRYPPGMGYWTVTLLDAPDQFLGWVLLAPEDMTGPAVETGWRFTTASRGNGYAPEAAARLISYGFADLGLHEIVADIHGDNKASRRVAEKIGMRTDPARRPTAPGRLLYVAAMHCQA
ncbi:MAG: GNAT family N-acetyltransferase [Pseudomonadota bacterium]